jgi:hypothetical protein
MMSLIIENDRSPYKQISKIDRTAGRNKKIGRHSPSLPHLSAGVPNSLLVLPWPLPENLRMQFFFQEPQPMNDVNQTPPDKMRIDERLDEVAQLLARGLQRLRVAHTNGSDGKSALGLGFSGIQRLHTDTLNEVTESH